jgi:hypothetical protein
MGHMHRAHLQPTVCAFPHAQDLSQAQPPPFLQCTRTRRRHLRALGSPHSMRKDTSPFAIASISASRIASHIYIVPTPRGLTTSSVRAHCAATLRSPPANRAGVPQFSLPSDIDSAAYVSILPAVQSTPSPETPNHLDERMHRPQRVRMDREHPPAWTRTQRREALVSTLQTLSTPAEAHAYANGARRDIRIMHRLHRPRRQHPHVEDCARRCLLLVCLLRWAPARKETEKNKKTRAQRPTSASRSGRSLQRPAVNKSQCSIRGYGGRKKGRRGCGGNFSLTQNAERRGRIREGGNAQSSPGRDDGRTSARKEEPVAVAVPSPSPFLPATSLESVAPERGPRKEGGQVSHPTLPRSRNAESARNS